MRIFATKVPILAIRQVDDLIAWSAWDISSHPTLKIARELLSTLTSGDTYTGGLSLKIQTPITDDTHLTINKFAGSLTTTYKDSKTQRQ